MRHRPSTVESWTAIAHEVRELIKLRSNEPHLRIADLALALNVSPRKLQRALAYDGTDFTRELYVSRMERAARILARGYWADVASRQSGFRSRSHFTVAFRRYSGVTPREFRRAARLEGRLKWRAWKDEVEPTNPGSLEYFRRRRRWREDQRALRPLVRKMLPAGRVALSANSPPKRPVFDLKQRQTIRVLATRHTSPRFEIPTEVSDFLDG